MQELKTKTPQTEENVIEQSKNAKKEKYVKPLAAYSIVLAEILIVALIALAIIIPILTK